MHTSHPAENILVREATHFPERKVPKWEVGSENTPFTRTESAEMGSWFEKHPTFPNSGRRKGKLVRKTPHFPERWAPKQEVGSENTPFSRTKSSEEGDWFGEPLKTPNGIDNNKKFN